MRNLMPITSPMRAADITEAAEEASKLAIALSDLNRAIVDFEAATGTSIAVVDADKAMMIGIDLASGPDETTVQIVAGDPPGSCVAGCSDPGQGTKRISGIIDQASAISENAFRAAALRALAADFWADRKAFCKAQQDAELLDAMYPQPVPEAGTISEALTAGAEAIADLVSEPTTAFADAVVKDMCKPKPNSIIKKTNNAPDVGDPISGDPKWQGKVVPAELRTAVQHIAQIGASGPKWGFEQDFEMIERAIDGQSEKLIADVMEFSLSHIRQRFNKLVDRTHGQGNRFTREQIRDALARMLVKEHAAF